MPGHYGGLVVLTRKDHQYMQLCFSIANLFSTCAKKKYGAIIVDDSGHVVGIGYNGGPSGFIHCDKGGCPRLAENSPNGSSYENCIAIHAEANALLHSDYSSRPIKLYVNGPPCFSCAKLIANSTIKSVYYYNDNDYKSWESVQSFLLQAEVNVYKVELNASI